MKRFLPIAALCLALDLAVVACGSTQISATVLSSYDAAVSAEILALKSGKVPPAEAQKLADLRIKAYAAVQAVVTAEQNGGTASASIANAATAAIAALLAEAQQFKGST